jgi:hypothetical protein
VIVFAGKNVDGAMSYVSYCSLNLFTEEQVVREFGAGHEFPFSDASTYSCRGERILRFVVGSDRLDLFLKKKGAARAATPSFTI